VRTLAAWQAISTRAEALELLRLAGAPASLIAPAEWEASPFDALERTTAPPPLAAPRGELPTPATPLIGRADEAALVARLFAGGARLVTLTGAGGAGKTRPALRSADDERRRGGEVAFAALAGLEDPREVPTTILRALGVAEVAGAAEADEDAPGCQSTSAPVGHPPACQHVTTL